MSRFVLSLVGNCTRRNCGDILSHSCNYLTNGLPIAINACSFNSAGHIQHYTRERLYALRSTIHKGPIAGRGLIFDDLNGAGLLRYRGVRAGVRKQRSITILSTAVPPTKRFARRPPHPPTQPTVVFLPTLPTAPLAAGDATATLSPEALIAPMTAPPLDASAAPPSPLSPVPPTPTPLHCHEPVRPPSALINVIRQPTPRRGACVSPSSFDPPSLYVFNANSIAKPHAIDHLCSEFLGYSTDIGVIVETHLKKKHPIGVEAVLGYAAFRRDRVGRRGGGVAVYVKNDFQASPCGTVAGDDDNFELLWVHAVRTGVSVLIGAIYHPPNPIYSVQNLLYYIESSVDILTDKYPGSLVILAGDLNTLDPQLVTILTGLTDIVTGPTRGTSCLDHILLSNPCYTEVKIVKTIGKSDHSAIIAYNGPVLVNISKTRTICKFRKRSPGINAAFLHYLSSLPEQHFSIQVFNLQAAFDAFYSKAISLLDLFYPERVVTLTSSDPRFVSPEIKSDLRRRNQLMRLGRVDEASALSVKIGAIITRHNANQLRQLQSDDGAQALWTKVREITGKSRAPPTQSGLTASLLNDHYATVSTDSTYTLPLCKNQTHSLSYTVSEFQIFCILDKLQHTATGLDMLPAWFLRLAAPVLARPLTSLFNLSLSTGCVPQQWKRSIILPLAKVPSPLLPSDFRPISITPVLSRVLERIIVSSYIYPALLIPPPNLHFNDQFAFRPTGSTTSALIYLLHKISAMLVSQPYVRVIALDFSKAFDSVRHSTLLSKLADLSLPDSIYNWVANFLTDRSHCTQMDGIQSSFANLTASVIQGSAIGPAAYTVLAADLHPAVLGNDMAKFADDTYLLVPANLSSTLDTELNHIEEWSTTNNLKLNRAKTREIIFYTRHHRPAQLPLPMTGITRVSSHKCLGVTLSSNFSVSEHITDVISSVAQSLYALRTLRVHGMHDELLQSVFGATALAKLRYCSPAWWGFSSASDMDRLNAALRKAARAKFYSETGPSFSDLCESADDKLFGRILSNPQHVLHQLLPPPPSHSHNLRKRHHDRFLPGKLHSLDDCNFITRMLFKDSY